MKLMQVFARQKHPGRGIIIFLVQCQHAKRRRSSVLDQEARPHDPSQHKKVNQILLESPG